jgi:hypothetical protein
MEVNGRTITGTIDYCEIDGNTCRIRDWKTAFFNHESEEEPDEPMGSLPDNKEWQGSFQVLAYAALLTFGRAGGSPFPLEGIERFEVELVHPRHMWEREGRMAYRLAIIDRDTILDLRVYLENLVGQVVTAMETGKWKAVPGDPHCDYCPASAECPIPGRLRDWRGEIRTVQDAEKALALRIKDQARAKKLWEAVKGWAELPGNAPFVAAGYEWYWEKTEKTALAAKVKLPEGGTITGKQALALDVERAAQYGTPFSLDEHYKPQISMTLKKRKLSEHELREREETDG